jgi:hypothetical protein
MSNSEKHKLPRCGRPVKVFPPLGNNIFGIVKETNLMNKKLEIKSQTTKIVSAKI